MALTGQGVGTLGGGYRQYIKKVANIRQERGSVVACMSNTEFHAKVAEMAYRFTLDDRVGAFVEIVSKDTRIYMTGTQWAQLEEWANGEGLTEKEMMQNVFDEGMKALQTKMEEVKRNDDN